jgi:hypothetical protein
LPIYPLAGMLLVSGLLFLAIDPTKSIITDETATIQPQLPQVEPV